MKFLCPYCKKLITGKLSRKCPHCGKVMNVPGGYLSGRSEEKRQRRKKKRQIRQSAERQEAREATGLPTFLQGRRKPFHVILPLIILVIAGGLLVGRLSLQTGQKSRTSRELQAMEELDALRIALEVFKHDTGKYPDPRDEGLKALVRDPGVDGWAGHYVTLIKPDPWHKKYRYSLEEGEVRLLSCGKDQECGTADDIHAGKPDPEIVEYWVNEQKKRKQSR